MQTATVSGHRRGRDPHNQLYLPTQWSYAKVRRTCDTPGRPSRGGVEDPSKVALPTMWTRHLHVCHCDGRSRESTECSHDSLPTSQLVIKGLSNFVGLRFSQLGSYDWQSQQQRSPRNLWLSSHYWRTGFAQAPTPPHTRAKKRWHAGGGGGSKGAPGGTGSHESTASHEATGANVNSRGAPGGTGSHERHRLARGDRRERQQQGRPRGHGTARGCAQTG